jgi:hypothetical protein
MEDEELATSRRAAAQRADLASLHVGGFWASGVLLELGEGRSDEFCKPIE